jgi:NAD(P)H-nitrite reductase large subunit
MGVSGCPNNCSESSIKDLGLVGTAKGWRVLAGGFVSGLKPRLADVIATDLNDEEALELIEKIVAWYERAGKAKRLGRVLDEIGISTFLEELGLAAAE